MSCPNFETQSLFPLYVLEQSNYYEKHWRNYLPRSYYITHSLAPIMWATGATPKKVSAMATFAPFEEEVNARMVGDRAAIVTTFNVGIFFPGKLFIASR